MTRARNTFVPMLLEAGGPLLFPDPTQADARGLVAVGGDLGIDRLRLGYANGIFPWFDDEDPPLWWSPDPRCILPLDDLHVPRSLVRRMAKRDYEISWNEAFVDVMRCCAEKRSDGTWITEQMIEAYTALHELGHAHSIEVWMGDRLVGGLYGVQIGGLFAAESKFHRETDMSKIAFVHAVRDLREAGTTLFDV
ncbi:MAG: leucyl/phenylalanyl-tRNA--protein transferase, partial [Planctomycetes bacterium]|nr:leucyl/phenylalanyl-tRNA--protein transferase [Planctomycetota bacterium]